MAEECILLVEGEDDEHVVRQLCRACNVGLNFSIERKDGYERLLKSIPVTLKRPGLRVLGVLADANDDLGNRWQEIVKASAGSDVRLPSGPVPSGTIVDSAPRAGRPRFGVWLMPDNCSAGELEDFARELVPPSDPVWPLAEGYIDGIPEENRRFKRGKISKANLYAWLASLEQPQRMGAAIGAGDLDAEAPLGQRFAKWLSKLFDE